MGIESYQCNSRSQTKEEITTSKRFILNEKKNKDKNGDNIKTDSLINW